MVTFDQICSVYLPSILTRPSLPCLIRFDQFLGFRLTAGRIRLIRTSILLRPVSLALKGLRFTSDKQT